MANTKIPVELSSTPGIVDGSNATAITIDSSENSTFAGTVTVNGAGNTLVLNASSGVTYQGFSENGTGRFFLATLNGADGLAFVDADGSAERMRIDSSGNVGIGTTSPSSYDFSDPAKLVAANTSGNSTISIVSGTSSYGYLAFADATSGTGRYSGYIFYNHSDDAIGFGSASAERMRIDSSGNVGIGSSPSSTIRNDVNTTEKALQVGRAAMLFSDTGLTTDLQNNTHLNNSDQRVAMVGTLAASFYQQYIGAHTFYTAAAVSAGSVQSFGARYTIDSSGGSDGSDIKLKENIENIPYGLDTIKSLQPRKFKWKETDKDGIGFIAQELESLIPELISEVYDDPVRPDTSEKTKMLNYSAMTAVLTKAIQEQQELIETQQTTINDLKSRIETLEG